MKNTAVSVIAILFALGAAPLAAAPRSLAQPVPVTADGAFTQRASGMVFPVSVGAFHRVGLMRYDAAGLDMSASYLLITHSGGVAATVYVSPLAAAGGDAARACRDEFMARRQAVLTTHADAVIVSDKAVSLVQGRTTHAGRHVVFTYGDTYGGVRHTLRSELYVFCDPQAKWEFEYRFSYPQGFDAHSHTAGFLHALLWRVATRR